MPPVRPPIESAERWFHSQGWQVFPFQKEAWAAYLDHKSGLVNAPTGSGKTYALAVPILLEGLAETGARRVHGLRALWITPLRALTAEIEQATCRAIEGMGMNWQVAVRSGDTTVARRKRQVEKPPQILVTTPESLHVLLSMKGYEEYFKDLKAVVADEWHELMGSKRGVQVELALSRLKTVAPGLKVWGISATIGNLDEAMHALLGEVYRKGRHHVVRSDYRKEIEITSLFPDQLEALPWAGNIGIRLLKKVIEVVRSHTSTLIFTNTRSFAEVWYQKMLDAAPELSGRIAMHHGSISQELRKWVENGLHEGKLKAVVCTSSLDLGVDFRPVEAVVQVGSPKGVARLLQRAGRSGHQPGALSKIYFVPTHALELIEASAIRTALDTGVVEERIPFMRSFDVLVQYLLTLAVGGGFRPEEIFNEVSGTYCYAGLSREEWEQLLRFLTTGGEALTAYDEYRKVVVDKGMVTVENRTVAHRHRLSIGTIVGDNSMNVRLITGKNLGTIEEWFISRLIPGDVFWFAGRALEFVRTRDMDAIVRKSKKKTGRVPSWQGGRMPLSSRLSELIRVTLDEAARGKRNDPEIEFIRPLLVLQQELSHLPQADEFLIEYLTTDEGYHLLFYPFEGRFVHEGLAALMAWRISRVQPITFSIAMNDYGFELLSDSEIPIEEALETNLLGSEDLLTDIQSSMNSTEMARRRFRDISSIAGLVFKGFPGQRLRDRHLQSSSQLFFDVFNDYEADNLLLRQAYEEVLTFQLEEARLRRALDRIAHQKVRLMRAASPTPLAFPILVDRLREKLTSEKLEARIRRMLQKQDLQRS
jgi:ATP-dependent Lhr-like helicase